MTTQLLVTNEALRVLGEPSITSTSDTTERGLIMAEIFPQAAKYAFEQSDWLFANIRVALALSATAPVWGYRNAFQLPADCYRVLAISRTGYEHDNVVEYRVEQGHIITDEDAIYLRYLSSNYLTAMGAWPQYFCDYVSAEMAVRGCPRLNKDAAERCEKNLKVRSKLAFSADGVNEPPARRQPGYFATARFGWRGGQFHS